MAIMRYPTTDIPNSLRSLLGSHSCFTVAQDRIRLSFLAASSLGSLPTHRRRSESLRGEATVVCGSQNVPHGASDPPSGVRCAMTGGRSCLQQNIQNANRLQPPYCCCHCRDLMPLATSPPEPFKTRFRRRQKRPSRRHGRTQQACSSVPRRQLAGVSFLP